MFLDARAGALFAGDHVLPHITPSIGLEPQRTAMPLGDYLASLALVRSMPDTILLPAHGPVAPSVHARVDELLAHHEARLTAIAAQAGRIEIDRIWYQPTSFRLTTLSGAVEHFRQPRIGQGLRYQAAEVGRCLREGRLESDVMPLDETLSIMATMDEVRRQIGLRYPGE